jgi:ADP-ribosylglycohydrolase
MLGAIAGDITDSAYEARPVQKTDFDLFPPGARFTDDTALTVAAADALLGDGDYAGAYRRHGRAFPNAGYGGSLFRRLNSADARSYNSWGNGAAMRLSPVGFARDTVDAVLAEAARSAAVTHDHPEGIKEAQPVALAVFSLAAARTRRGSSPRSKIASAMTCRAALPRSVPATNSMFPVRARCASP